MADPPGSLEISDFSPGIWGDFHASAAGEPFAADDTQGVHLENGRATIENTYRCQADPSGALTPLPRSTVDTVFPDTQVDTWMNNPAFMIADNGNGDPMGLYVLDVVMSPQVSQGLVATPGVLAPQGTSPEYRKNRGSQSICVLYGFWFDRAGNGTVNGYNSYILGREFRNWIEDPSIVRNLVVDFLITRSEAKRASTFLGTLPFGQGVQSFSADPDGWVDANTWRSSVTVLVQPPDPYMTLLDRLLVDGNITLTANEKLLLMQVWPGFGSSLADLYNTFHPVADQDHMSVMLSSTQSPNPYFWSARQRRGTFFEPRTSGHLVTHQGRTVIAEHDIRTVGAWPWSYDENDEEIQLSTTVEVLNYTPFGAPIGRFTLTGGTAIGHYPARLFEARLTRFVPAEDLATVTGAMGTVTNDQLIMVRHTGGGLLVSGDLDNPTVRRMPAMESTQGVVSNGVQTPVGWVYGSRRGVYVWQGGDHSQRLSPQIDGFFWNHIEGREPILADEPYNGPQGRFGFWSNFVCVPNNYLFDINTSAWWRIQTDEDEDNKYPIHVYNVTTEGDLLATPYKIDLQQRVVAHRFKQEDLDYKYSWQSHPLVGTRGRSVSVQDIRILATPNSPHDSTIKVTLTGFDIEGQPVAHETTFTMSPGERPQMLRKDIMPNFQADYLQARIEAETDPDGWAPKIHSLRIGLNERVRQPRLG